MADLDIISTSDGSHSLRNNLLNETFHSTHGAIRESVHVYINNGLLYNSPPQLVRVLEVGFGTGLNALLTFFHTTASQVAVHYTTLETNPLSMGLVSQLNYPDLLDFVDAELIFKKMHDAPWGEAVFMRPDFILNKQLIRIQDAVFENESYDLIYYDAFAPSKQPELWELAVLEKVVQSMSSGGIFVTYCAKGQLKRDLKNLGLQIETLSGPPGKKEMVRATKS